jgi:hypothetical protein
LLTALLLGGCSNYDARWRAAQRLNAIHDLFEGTYEGTWESSRYKGARGKLWCILKRQSGDVYSADFRATWHGIFSSEHSVLLRVTDRRTVKGMQHVKFAGAAEIRMWIGSGHYRCTGEMTPLQLTAEYDASADRGTFRLERVMAAGSVRR